MHRTPGICLLFLVSSLAVAQQPQAKADDPLQAGRPRLRAALAKTAAMHDVAFTARWAKNTLKKGDPTPLEVAIAAQNEGALQGSWHQGLQHCRFEGDRGDELLVAGRRTIAKDGQNGWVLRAGRFADGNPAGFVADPQSLLDQLAAWDLAVVHREVGSLDDRPVEVLSVALTQDQVADAVWGGLLPESLVSDSSFGAMRLNLRMGGPGARPAAQKPTSTVDVAITLDPSTGLVHQLQFRSWTKEDAAGGMAQFAGGQVLVVRGGALPAAAKDEEEAEEEAGEGADKKAPAPLQYENGLPKRPRKKTTVMDYTVRLTEHGSKAAPGLDELQKKLLQR